MMSKLSIVLFAVLLISVVCADKKLEKAKRRCRISLVAASRELTEKYHGTSWFEFGDAVRDEAFAIYSNGSREIHKLRMQVFQAKTIEVTKKVKTHSGTIIECSVDVALLAAAIADKTSRNLDELSERATRGKGRV